MGYHSKFIDRMVSFCLYSALIMMPIWAGTKVVNLTLDQIFISKFVLGWEQVVLRLQETESRFPVMKDRQLVASMVRIEALAEQYGIELPVTNTDRSFAHHLKKLAQPEQKIFLIIDQGRIIIYGLRQQTLQRIDKHVDGTINLNAGSFQATPGKSMETYTGLWKL